ncbi:MAG: hypothetical protein HYT70_01270 [Candidatus Aenigmarchaeota archaeon]|nr:hypothetical protein [Candidatus Aenigmarchaeota archaeon]
MAHLGFEIGEVFSLFIILVGYVIIIIEFVNHKNLLHLFLAYTFLLVGSIATVVESFYLADIMNLVEHVIGMAAAGIAFGITSFLAYRKITALDSGIKRKLR